MLSDESLVNQVFRIGKQRSQLTRDGLDVILCVLSRASNKRDGDCGAGVLRRSTPLYLEYLTSRDILPIGRSVDNVEAWGLGDSFGYEGRENRAVEGEHHV